MECPVSNHIGFWIVVILVWEDDGLAKNDYLVKTILDLKARGYVEQELGTNEQKQLER